MLYNSSIAFYFYVSTTCWLSNYLRCNNSIFNNSISIIEKHFLPKAVKLPRGKKKLIWYKTLTQIGSFACALTTVNIKALLLWEKL